MTNWNERYSHRILPGIRNRSELIRHLVSEHDMNEKGEEADYYSDEELAEIHMDDHPVDYNRVFGDGMLHKHITDDAIGSPMLKHLIEEHSADRKELLKLWKRREEGNNITLDSYHASDHKHNDMPHEHLDPEDIDDWVPKTSSDQRYSHITIPGPDDINSLIRHMKHEHGIKTFLDSMSPGGIYYDSPTTLLEIKRFHNLMHEKWELYDGITGNEDANYHQHSPITKHAHTNRVIPLPKGFDDLIRHFLHEHDFPETAVEHYKKIRDLTFLQHFHDTLHYNLDPEENPGFIPVEDNHIHGTTHLDYSPDVHIASRKLPEVPESAILRHLDYDHNLNENNVDTLLDYLLANAIDVNTVSDLHDYIHEEHGHSHGFSPHTHTAGLRRSSEEKKLLPPVKDLTTLLRHLNSDDHPASDVPLGMGDSMQEYYNFWMEEQTGGDLHRLPDDFHEHLHRRDEMGHPFSGANHRHAPSTNAPLTWADLQKRSKLDAPTEVITGKNLKKIKNQKLRSSIKGSLMNWKNRYAHENYEITLDHDDPMSIASHLIQGHANNFDNMSDDLVESIVSDAKRDDARWHLHQLHAFLHRKHFMREKIDHEHPGESFEVTENG